MVGSNKLKYPIDCYFAELKNIQEFDTFLKHAIYAKDENVKVKLAQHITTIINNMRNLDAYCSEICGEVDCLSKYLTEIPRATNESLHYSSSVTEGLEQLIPMLRGFNSIGNQALLGALKDMPMEISN